MPTRFMEYLWEGTVSLECSQCTWPMFSEPEVVQAPPMLYSRKVVRYGIVGVILDIHPAILWRWKIIAASACCCHSIVSQFVRYATYACGDYPSMLTNTGAEACTSLPVSNHHLRISTSIWIASIILSL